MSKDMKYSDVNLTKHVQNLYAEKITKKVNKGRHILCSWFGRLDIVNMSIVPQTDISDGHNDY